MSLTRLIFREIFHRKFAFLVGVLSITAVVAVVTAMTSVLEVYQRRTDQFLEEQREDYDAVMEENKDEYRKIGLKPGFNLLIMSADQDTDEFLETRYITEDMPEENIHTLADSNIDTVRHLLAMIERPVTWPERNDDRVVLAGTHGEIPKSHGSKLPLMQPVKPGTVVLGYRLWNGEYQPGDMFPFQGKEYEVAVCNPERGSRDDLTLWLDLDEAQRILDAEGRIDAILALKCHCDAAMLESIRTEIEGVILPGTQVSWDHMKIEVRAAGRDQASRLDEETTQVKASEHEELTQSLGDFSAWFLPLLVVGACVWIGLLALLNVQQRSGEIGILRAIGYKSEKIHFLILGRLFIIGLIGGLLGYALGAGIASLWCVGDETIWLNEIVSRPSVIFNSCAGAAILAVIVGLPPSVLAANRDPADVLRFDS